MDGALAGIAEAGVTGAIVGFALFLVAGVLTAIIAITRNFRPKQTNYQSKNDPPNPTGRNGSDRSVNNTPGPEIRSSEGSTDMRDQDMALLSAVQTSGRAMQFLKELERGGGVAGVPGIINLPLKDSDREKLLRTLPKGVQEMLKRKYGSPPGTLSDPGRAGGDIADEIFVGREKAKLVLEYSDEARDSYDRLSELPEDYRQRFVQKLEENPSLDPAKFAGDLIDEYAATSHPYEQEDLNDAYQVARKMGPEAESEFRAVVDLLGDRADAQKILTKLQQKFPSSFTMYEGYLITEIEPGMFQIHFRDGGQVPATQNYTSRDDARAAIDLIFGLHKR